MIRNKSTTYFNNVDGIDPEKLPFDIKNPPKDVVRDIIFTTHLYTHKFNHCEFCLQKQEKAECCGGKKFTASCSKLDIKELVPANCLFCNHFTPVENEDN